MIELPPDLCAGTVLRLDEQVYELRGAVPHLRKDGAPTELLVWETKCPACGAAFEVRTSRCRTGLPNRRCERCRKVGKPVKGKRGRRVKVEVLAP